MGIQNILLSNSNINKQSEYIHKYMLFNQVIGDNLNTLNMPSGGAFLANHLASTDN